MCNLYSITTNQEAIRALFRVMNRYVGNLPPMPGVFPDYPAPVVRNAGAGVGGLTAALALARAGFDAAIFERAAVLEEFGAGVQLTPNARRILARFGALE